jgi:hypothetical protein
LSPKKETGIIAVKNRIPVYTQTAKANAYSAAAAKIRKSKRLLRNQRE